MPHGGSSRLPDESIRGQDMSDRKECEPGAQAHFSMEQATVPLPGELNNMKVITGNASSACLHNITMKESCTIAIAEFGELKDKKDHPQGHLLKILVLTERKDIN